MSKKHTIEYVRGLFEEGGYILLTKEYKNAHQKLEYICPENHKHSISWNVWQQGHRCYYCVGNVKPTIEFIRSEFRKEGYVLLGDRYVNNKTKLDYICPEKHRYSMQ